MFSAIASVLGSSPGSAAWAQDKWPSKPITYIVPFPAGGTTDILGRLIGQKLGPVLGTTIVVDNRAGAGGSVGSEIAARAPADGYTLLGGTVSSHAINVSLYPKLGYDPIKSFSPVALIGTNPVVLIVGQNSPYKTLQDVLAAAKAKPKTISSASAGNGTDRLLSFTGLAQRANGACKHQPKCTGWKAKTPRRRCCILPVAPLPSCRPRRSPIRALPSASSSMARRGLQPSKPANCKWHSSMGKTSHSAPGRRRAVAPTPWALTMQPTGPC